MKTETEDKYNKRILYYIIIAGVMFIVFLITLGIAIMQTPNSP